MSVERIDELREKLALAEAQLAALEEEFRTYGAFFKWEKWHWRGGEYTWADLLRVIVEARKDKRCDT